MADPVLQTARPHASHDLSLIAAAAAGDLADAALRDADALAASCPDCAALLSDLVAIAAATRSLPDPIRPRSFTLSDEQAARLRPTGWRRFGRPRLERTRMARPVALACTTLGLAGLLLATLPATPTGFLGLSGGAAAPGVTASAPERDLRSSQAIEASPDQGDVASPAGGEGPAVSPVVPAAEAPAASSDTAFGSTDGEVVAGASKEPVDVNERPADAPVAALDEPGPSALAIASAGLLVIGLLMLGLVFVAGRRHPGSDDQA